MEILLSILYCAIFIFLIYKLKFFNIPGLSCRALSIVFLIKVLSAVALTLIFTHYYNTRSTADIFKYFDDGRIIFSSVHDNPVDYLRMVTGIDSDAEHLKTYYTKANYWYKEHNYNLYNDNRTIIRFNAVIMLFSFGYFHVHNVFMAFLSFIGLTAIFKAFYSRLREKRTALLLAVYFIPSVLLWTSGVLKEGLLMFAFGLLIYNLVKISMRQYKIIHLVNLIICILLLLITKIYILAAAVPGFISLFWLIRTNSRKAFLKVIIVHAAAFILALNMHYVFKDYDLLNILSHKQRDFKILVEGLGNVGSAIDLPELKPEITSLFRNTPYAFYNSFFRPHIFEMHSLMAVPAALENLFIIILIICGIVFFSPQGITFKPLFYFSISFFLILFILAGLTTPVLGTLVRYKAPALPFLFFIVIFITDKNKFLKFIDTLNFFNFNLKIFNKK